jgi:hypothetical protein
MFPLPLDQWLAAAEWAKRPLPGFDRAGGGPAHDWLAPFCLCNACQNVRARAGEAQMPETD